MIDDEFFAEAKLLAENVREAAVRSIADREGLAISELRKLISGTETKEAGAGEPSFSYEAAIDRIEKDGLRRRVLNELAERTAMSVNLRYANGYAFHADHLDEIKEVLERGSGRPESIAIVIGSYYRGAFVSLRVRDGVRSASFELRGERERIDSLQNNITHLLACCEPDHPWVHSIWFRSVCGVIISLFLFYLIIAGISRLQIEFVPWWMAGLLGVSSGLIGNNLIPWLIGRAYPKCEFRFGRHGRRQAARRRILAGALTVIVLPVALELLL